MWQVRPRTDQVHLLRTAAAIAGLIIATVLIGSWLMRGSGVAWQPYSEPLLVEAQRLKRNIKSLKESGREPTYISTAADEKHRLGTNDPPKIEVIEI